MGQDRCNVLYGSYVSGTTNIVTMTGPDQAGLSVTNVISPYSSTDHYISRFDFTNAELYDKITVTYDSEDMDGSPASRARYLGLIFDGVPIPLSGTVILVK